MPSVVLLVLFLCLFMHACNARRLGFIDKEIGSEVVYHSVEEVEKDLRVYETSTSLMMRPTISLEYQVEVKNAETVATDEIIPNALLSKQGRPDGPTSGDDSITFSSQIDQKKSIKMKGLKRHARTLLGYEYGLKRHARTLLNPTHEIGEDKDSKGNETTEDVGVMDYAQPHRKPPIHNEKS